MSMMVQTSTDDAPELLARIEHRRANGLDRYDEWWEGVYRIVTGPSPEHGEFVVDLGALLLPKARARGSRSIRNSEHRASTRTTQECPTSGSSVATPVARHGRSWRLPSWSSRSCPQASAPVRNCRSTPRGTSGSISRSTSTGASVRLLQNADGGWTPVDAEQRHRPLGRRGRWRCCHRRDRPARSAERFVNYTQPMLSRYSGANEAMRERARPRVARNTAA